MDWKGRYLKFRYSLSAEDCGRRSGLRGQVGFPVPSFDVQADVDHVVLPQLLQGGQRGRRPKVIVESWRKKAEVDAECSSAKRKKEKNVPELRAKHGKIFLHSRKLKLNKNKNYNKPNKIKYILLPKYISSVKNKLVNLLRFSLTCGLSKTSSKLGHNYANKTEPKIS